MKLYFNKFKKVCFTLVSSLISSDQGRNISKELNVIMLKFSSTRREEIRSEVTFRGTLLRNGIMSLSDELKYASDYDNILNSATDSLFDNISSNHVNTNSLSDNLEENVMSKEELEEAHKNILSADITHNNATCDYDFVNNTCQCFYKTSTPIRIEFDPYEEIIQVPKVIGKKAVKLQTTRDNLEEIRRSDEDLEHVLNDANYSVVQQGACNPRVRKSFRKMGRTSKKGALTVFTVVLSNIV